MLNFQFFFSFLKQQGFTALMYAAKNNNILCVENILKLSDVNVKWKDNV